MYKLSLVFGVVAILVACERAADNSEPFDVDTVRIDAALNNLVETESLIGVSAIVHVDGEERYFGAFGHADREAEELMQRDTLVQIFSMTKPITGVALMTLYEDGKFDLNAPLSRYAPEFNGLVVFNGLDEKGEITVEPLKREPTVYDILRHTAGFVSNHGGDSPLLDYATTIDPDNRENTLMEFVEKLGRIPLRDQPGEQWLYGPAVNVQAALVEKISGVAFDQYVQRTIFDPLGMKNTQWVLKEGQIDKMAALYNWQEDGSFVREPDDKSYAYYAHDWPMKYGSWGLTSTLDDYARFAQMLVGRGSYEGKQILKPETVALMASDAIPETVKDRSWLVGKGEMGFGINFAVRVAPPASREEASGEVGEFFWDGAANTLFWVDPVNKLTAVLFTQYRPFGKVPLHKTFRDAVYAHDETASANLLHKVP